MNTPAPQVEMVSELQRLSELADSGVWSFEQIDDNEYGQTVYSVDTDEFTQELAEFYGDKSSVEFVCALVNWFRENQAALNARAGGDGWLPIESAPIDGTTVIVALDTGYTLPAYWQHKSFYPKWYGLATKTAITGNVVAYQPMPVYPAALASQAVGVGS